MTRTREAQSPARFLLALHDAALLLAIFLAPIFWGRFNTDVATVELGATTAGLSGLTLTTFLVSLAALAALAWRWVTRGRPAVLPNAIHLPALLFVAISAVATLTSVNVYASTLELIRLGIGAVLFLLIANRALLPAAPREWTLALFVAGLPLVFFTYGAEDPISSKLQSLSWLDVLVWMAAAGGVALWFGREGFSLGRRGLEALALSAGVVSVWAIFEKIVTATAGKDPTWQPMSTFFTQNALGGFLAMLLPVTAVLLLTSQARGRKLAFGVVGLCGLAALVFTESKGAFLGLFVAIVVGALLVARLTRQTRRAIRGVVLVLLLLGLLAAAVIVFVPQVHGRVITAFGPGNASNMFRVLTWTGTWHMALDHPWVGVGPSAFENIFGKYTIAGFTKAAHEAYLQVAAEQGFGGLAVYLWLLVAMFLTGWRVVGNAARPFEDRLLAAGAMGGLLVLLTHDLLDNDWYIGAFGVTFWLLAGLLAHLSHGRTEEVAAGPTEAGPGKAKRRRLREAADLKSAPRRKVRQLLWGRASAESRTVASSAVPVEAGRTKTTRKPKEAAVPPPAADREVHRLPWPRSAGGGALAFLWCAVVLGAMVSFAARSDLAQHAEEEGSRAWGMANELAASQKGENPDLSVMQQIAAYSQLSVARFQSAVQYAPSWAGAHEVYARSVELVRGDFAEAEREFKTAIKCAPESYQYRASLALFYDDQKRWPEAIRAYEDALSYFPQHTRTLKLLGDMYLRKGDEANALRTYRRLLATETQPINTVRAIDNQTDIDDTYAYAHYEVGRDELKAFARTRDPKLFASMKQHFIRTLAVVEDYRAGGNRVDEIYRLLHRPRGDRLPKLLFVAAKARLRLAQALAMIGGSRAAGEQRAAAAQLFAKDPDPAKSLAAVEKEVAQEDAGRRS